MRDGCTSGYEHARVATRKKLERLEKRNFCKYLPVCFLRAQSNPNGALWLLATGSSVKFLCEEFPAKAALLSAEACPAAELPSWVSQGNSFSQHRMRATEFWQRQLQHELKKVTRFFRKVTRCFMCCSGSDGFAGNSFMQLEMYFQHICVKYVEELWFSSLVTTRESWCQKEVQKSCSQEKAWEATEFLDTSFVRRNAVQSHVCTVDMHMNTNVWQKGHRLYLKY